MDPNTHRPLNPFGELYGDGEIVREEIEVESSLSHNLTHKSSQQLKSTPRAVHL